MITKKLYKAIYFIVSTFSLVIMTCFYNYLFIKRIKDPNPYYAVIFHSGNLLSALFYSITVFISLSLIKRNIIIYIASSFIYTAIFTINAYSIFFDNRISFPPMTNSEIMNYYVLSNWYYYVFLIFGLLINFFLNFLYIKKCKDKIIR